MNALDLFFSQTRHIKTHYDTDHLCLKPYECIWDSCSYAFFGTGSLNQNIDKMHKKLKPTGIDILLVDYV